MSLFPECNGLNKNHRDDPGIWSTTPEFGSKRTPHLRSTVPNVQRHMAYFAGGRERNEEVAEGVFKHTKSTRWPCLATARRLRRMVLVPQKDEEEEEEREEGTSERCFSQEEEGAIV